MANRHITLVIPGLFDAVSGQQAKLPACPALGKLLAKSDACSVASSDYHDLILEQFDVELTSRGCIAAVSRFAESGLQDERIWMQLNPVYLHADKDRLLMQGSEILQIQPAESQELINALNELYHDDPWSFESYTPDQWYMVLDEEPSSEFVTYHQALGRSVDQLLPQGSDKVFWHRFINEVQMFMHTADINQTRWASQQLPINSIWCWGVGKLPASVSASWHAVHTDNVFATGLARLAGVDTQPLPRRAADVLVKKPGAQSVSNELVIFSLHERGLLSVEDSDYYGFLQSLEQDWIAPLLEALQQGVMASLTLITDNGKRYELRRRHLYRFWRRQKPFASLLKALSK